jgi:hypothetical protein
MKALNTALVVKLMFFMHNILGGIYVSTSVSKRIKYVWAIVNAVYLMMFAITPTVYYTIIHLNHPINFIDLVEGLLTMMGVFHIVIIIPFLTVYYHADIESVLEYLSNSKNEELILRCETVSQSDPFAANHIEEECRSTFTGIVTHWNPIRIPAIEVVFIAIGNSIFILFPIIFITFVTSDNPHLLQHYPLPIPFYDRSPGTEVYYLIVLLQAVLVVAPIVLISVSHYIFILTFALQMNNITFNYCKRIYNLAKVANKFFEQSTCTTLPRERTTIQFIRNFEQDLAAIIKRYRKYTE